MKFRFTLENVIKFCILAGIFTHPIWFWSFKTTFVPKPSDFFFALAMVGALFYFFTEGRQKLAQIPKLLYLALFLFGLSVVFSTFIGYIRYDIPFGSWHQIVYHLFRIGGGFILLLFVYILFGESSFFRKWLYSAFLASSAVFIPFLALPSLAKNFSLFSGERFLGLAGNPGMFAILMFPSFVFILFLLLRALLGPNVKSPVFPIFVLWFFTFCCRGPYILDRI